MAEIAGLLLAGGGSRRMGGGDKCLRPLGGRPLLAHVIERLEGQVDELVLNANGDGARFAAFGLPVVADSFPGQAGPLAGILTGMEWLRAERPEVTMMLSVPTDGPFLPLDLCARLMAAKGAARIACARSGGRSHPPISLWDVDLADDLRRAMRQVVRLSLAQEDLLAQSGIAGGNVSVIVDGPVAEVDSEQGTQTGDLHRHL